MSDYTPTTEEVRDDYALLADASRPRHMQFDRWLVEVKAQAWEEGYAAGDSDAHTENRLDSSNPYRGETK